MIYNKRVQAKPALSCKVKFLNTRPESFQVTRKVESAALVLAGGTGRRMGASKPFMPWHGSVLIERVVERLVPVFPSVYIVASEDASFVSLGLPVIRDVEPGRGPLMGLYSGLLASGADWCFLVGCDMPLLSAEVIREMAKSRGDADVVAARVKGRVQFLHAFYSRRCIPVIDDLLKHGKTSLWDVVTQCSATILPERRFSKLDPGLLSFTDVDTPEELARLTSEATA